MKYLYKSESYFIPQRLLFIPIKETVIFPYVIAPLFFQTDEAVVEELLGPRKFFREIAQERDRIGVVTGLAWTER